MFAAVPIETGESMQILKCYVAGPLFSNQDRDLLEQIAGHFESQGVSVYLPHRDGGDLGTLIYNAQRDKLRNELFKKDIENLKDSNFVVCLLDGQDVDSGTCVEIGIAFAMDLPIFGLKTDIERRGSVINNMVWGACDSGNHIFEDIVSLFSAVDRVVRFQPERTPSE